MNVYLRVVSREPVLAVISIGLSPYTQRRPSDLQIATVRSSTQLSSGFNLARHRSTAWWSSYIDSKRAHFVPHSKLLRTCLFPSLADQPLNLANDQNLGIFLNARQDAAYIIATPCQPVPNWFLRSFHPAKDTFRSRYL